MGMFDVVAVLRRRWPIIAAVFAVCVISAGTYVLMQTKEYVATSRLYVTMATGTSVADSYQGGLAARDRVPSYVDLVSGPQVAQRVLADLGLHMSQEELQAKISATFPPATAIIDVSVRDASPDQAKLLADTVAEQLIGLVGEIETIQDGRAPAARVRLIDSAQIPTVPSSPATMRILATGALAGLLLGWLTGLVQDRLSARRPAHARSAPRHGAARLDADDRDHERIP
ncbi:hypothetical protein E4P42_11185 [Mycobacterium sp. PS03-16]|nr:hypothetical protein E4P42_11185 [Mycobacterium sp. PS03-16]